MLYILFNSISLFFCYILDMKSTSLVKILIGFLFVLCIYFLPSVQYGVGTDYFSYMNIFYDHSQLLYIFKKNEFAFYYFTLFVSSFASFETYIMIIVFIQSVLIFLTIFYLKKKGLASFLILFLTFFCVTNLMHTQMNLIRASFAMYLFAISFIFHADKKQFIAICICLLASLFHASALIVLMFLLLPRHFYIFISKNLFFVYTFSFFLFFFAPLDLVLKLLIDTIAPNYSFYFFGGAPSVSFLNILSKVYYVPLHFVLFYLVKRRSIVFTDFQSVLVGMWCLTSNVYLLMLSFDFLSRINYFFVFFYIIPISLVLYKFWLCRNWFYFSFWTGFIILPYVIKVIFFPIAEFSYDTYLF